MANSDLEAICRMVSLWLRAGGNIRLVIKQLEGIGSSLQIPTRAGRIMSLGDGLACALKKYMRAKERFGLRNLLLGEINLAELDSPNPPPLHADQTLFDHTVPPSPGGNGGHGSGEPGVAKHLAAAKPQVDLRAARSGARTTKSRPPRARQSRNGNGRGKQQAPDEISTGAAVVELSIGSEPVETLELWSTSTVLDVPETMELSAVERRASGAADLALVLGPISHRHDGAEHYKVLCPECGSPLMLQEGCRKCANPGCGWAAC